MNPGWKNRIKNNALGHRIQQIFYALLVGIQGVRTYRDFET